MIQEQKIQYYANNIAKELCDMPSFSIENVYTMLISRIRLMMHDVLNDEISILEKERSLMVEEYASDKVPSWRKRELQAKIAQINVEINKSKKNAHLIQISSEYELLKRHCKDNLPNEFMEQYYELQKQIRH